MKTIFLVPFVAVGLAACSNFSRTSGVAVGSTAPQQSATLVAGRSGAYVALLPKGTLAVQLQSNQAAGYRWRLATALDESVVKLESTPNASNALPPIALAPNSPTAPQPETWTFKAVGPGTAKVRMIYSRPNQPLNEAATYDFTINAE